jgi:hypothetical protein
MRHAVEQQFAAAERHEPVKQRWRARRDLPSNPAHRLPSWATTAPVDLVWRAPSDKPSASVARATTSREPDHTVATTMSVHAPPPSKTTERPMVCATALEPGLADRFAADVIRRIDRRARIERERKGM